ncbi:hypothetical protein GGR56DRAFT_645641 [Xylariaceae sp. FL0804]|nr:hypothetical protein GGR56DRAFT_645641 [Xylariaceae sp. FL0804]
MQEYFFWIVLLFGCVLLLLFLSLPFTPCSNLILFFILDFLFSIFIWDLLPMYHYTEIAASCGTLCGKCSDATAA